MIALVASEKFCGNSTQRRARVRALYYEVFLRRLLAGLHLAVGVTHEDKRAHTIAVRDIGGKRARPGASCESATIESPSSTTRTNAAQPPKPNCSVRAGGASSGRASSAARAGQGSPSPHLHWRRNT